MLYLKIKEGWIKWYFELDILLYSKDLQNYIIIQNNNKTAPKITQIVSIARSISFISYYLIWLFGLKSHGVYLTHMKSLSFMLTILLKGYLFLGIKQIRIFFIITKQSLKKTGYLLIHLTGFTIAFILSGNLLFSRFEHFRDIKSTSASIFALMSGDCVLDFFNEIKEEGYIGFFYIIFVIFYLIIFWQTLYVTQATDSYFETIDKEEEIESNN